MESIANIGLIEMYSSYNDGVFIPYLQFVDCRKYDKEELLATGVIAYILKDWDEYKAIKVNYGEYYLSCKEQYILEHHRDADAWRRNLYEEFNEIHIKQEKEKIRNSNNISDIVSEEDATLLRTYANEYLQYAQQRIKEEREQRDNVEINPEPNILPDELNTDKGREVLSRGIKAGLIDDNFQPIKDKMTKGQMKIFALCASIECGIQYHFKVFERLWQTKNLAQVKEYEMKIDRIKQIEALFSKDVVKKYKLERGSR